MGAGGDGLDNVAGILDAAVGDDGDAVFIGHFGALENGGDLGHADAGDHAGGADGAGADAHLDAVRASLDESLGALGGGHVARDKLHLREFFLYQTHAAQDVGGVAVGGIQHESVHAHAHQRGGAVENVVGDAQRGGAQQAAGGVLGGIGILENLFDVLDGDEALELVILVHDGQLFDLVLLQDGLGLVEGGTDEPGDEIVPGHGGGAMQHTARLSPGGGEPDQRPAVIQPPILAQRADRGLVAGQLPVPPGEDRRPPHQRIVPVDRQAQAPQQAPYLVAMAV